MGVLDKFLDIMKLNDGDDYDDDFFDDDYEDDYEEEKPKKSLFGGRPKNKKKKRMKRKATKWLQDPPEVLLIPAIK